MHYSTRKNASTTSPMNSTCRRALFPTNSVYSNKTVWSRTAGKERLSITLFLTLMFSQLLPRDLTIFGNKLIPFRNLTLNRLRQLTSPGRKTSEKPGAPVRSVCLGTCQYIRPLGYFSLLNVYFVLTVFGLLQDETYFCLPTIL